MLRVVRPLALSAIFMLFFSCANYKLNLNDQVKDWKSSQPSPNLKISHSLYLIGDAGDAGKNPSSFKSNLIKSHLNKADKNSTVIFLGDNIYPVGLPPKDENDEHRKTAEANLNAQIDAAKDFKGRVVFMPGNHDWYKYYQKGLKRQEKYIEKAFNEGIEDEDNWSNIFIPDDGCSGPEVLEINDKLVLLIIDSEWWIMDWDNANGINEGCENKTREAFLAEVADALDDHRGKNIVIATHHPFRSYGPHGGKFTWKDHLFPATALNDNLYIPMPGLGSLFMFIRGSGIIRQDLANTHYKSLSKALLALAKKQGGEYVFVSGHEHSLQYNKDKGQHFIVSGAGSKSTQVAKHKKSMFGYGHQGFARMDIYENGEMWVNFYVPNDQDPMGKLVFRQKVKSALPSPKSNTQSFDFTEYEQQKDSTITYPVTFPVRKMKGLAGLMLGERHRDIYIQQYKLPVLDLSTYKGGLVVIKKGGGKQTNSLRLRAPDGKEYVMRSLTKDVTRGVPYPFNQLPFVNFLFSDTFLGSHPFAPLSVPTLADAAKVYHTNPGIYYIPKQPALDKFNDKFGGEVYLVEERASQSWPDLASFGNATKFINTYKLSEKRVRNNKHIVDQKWVVRSRIFDLLLGDFDRHDDQWRWTVDENEEGLKTYRPIPRDRDNVYSNYDGLAVKLMRPYHKLLRQLGTYNEDVGNMRWATYNTRFFDHDFTNELTLEDWLAEAKFIQDNLTDDLIDEALNYLPKKAYSISGEHIKKTLKYRRDNLQEIAKGLFMQLAKKTAVVGTEKKDLFEVKRLNDKETEVSVYRLGKDGEKKEQRYHRIIKTDQTEEIYLFGLEDKDKFHITGKVNKGPKIRVVGGEGKDHFLDESSVKGALKKNKYYDTKTGNTVELGTEGKDKTSNIYEHNTYNRLGNYYDEHHFVPIPLMGFNDGDGFTIGFSGIIQRSKFNKLPLGRQHKFGVNYLSATQGLLFTYNSTFFQIGKSLDLVINSEYRTNGFSFNYFGLGNETIKQVSGINFYRVNQKMIHLDIGIQRRFLSDVGKFSIRPLLQRVETENNPNRFLSMDIQNNGVDPSDLEGKWYTGFYSELNFDKVDNPISPRDGFRFHTKFTYQKTFNGADRDFRKFGADFTIYHSLGFINKMVIASRVGGEVIGGDYDFFFAPALGQDENLRGFFGQRFRGEKTFFHTSDLRWEIGSSSNPVLPLSFGISAGFDYGRVWQPGESSDTWHTCYGGGLFLMPLNVITASVSYFTSNGDGGRILFTLNHAF